MTGYPIDDDVHGAIGYDMPDETEHALYHAGDEFSDWALAQEDAPGVEEDELLWKRNRLSMYQSDARPVFGGEDVHQMRERIRADMERLYESTEPGVWLIRHPPGSGKTFAFAAAVKRDEYQQKSIIACAPNVAEAKRLAQDAGLSYLGSKSAETCAIIAENGNQAKILAKHERNGHRGKHFCKTCQHAAACRSTPGQYRHDHQRARREIAAGTARVAMTAHMLRFLAGSLPTEGNATVVWTDEDLWGHIVQPIESISREAVDDWIKHALAAGDWPREVSFMRRLSRHMDEARLPEGHDWHSCPDRAELHADRIGLSALLQDAETRAAADDVAGLMDTDPTHDSERVAEGGAPLAIQHWRPALLSRCVDLVRGSCFVRIDRKDFRSLHGSRINRDILRIPRVHRLLQSDATASPDFWRLVWRDQWRGMLDGAPRRAIAVRWEPASVLSGALAAGDDLPLRKAIAKAIHLHRQHGRVGILTHLAWLPRMVAALRGARHRVLDLKESSDTTREVDFVVGSFGAHDRGVNVFKEAKIAAFLIAGTFRPPMSSHHEKVAALMAMGVRRMREAHPGGRCFPLATDGTYLVQDAHRGLVSADPRTTWVADHERGAHLAQAIERVRSVDREANGLPPIPVYLYGPEACMPPIPLPVQYEA